MTDSILLIHDDPNVLRSIGARFEEAACEVIRELSLDAGVATLERLRPDAILLSMSLAGQDDAIARLRRHEAPVVVFGDSGDPGGAARALHAGAADVVESGADPA